MNVPLDELGALLVVDVLMDAFARLTIDDDSNGVFPTDAQRGAVILAELIMARCYPQLDPVRLPNGLKDFRAALARVATAARRDYGIAEVQ